MKCQNALCENPDLGTAKRCPYCSTQSGRTRFPFERELIIRLWVIIILSLLLIFICALLLSILWLPDSEEQAVRSVALIKTETSASLPTSNTTFTPSAPNTHNATLENPAELVMQSTTTSTIPATSIPTLMPTATPTTTLTITASATVSLTSTPRPTATYTRTATPITPTRTSTPRCRSRTSLDVNDLASVTMTVNLRPSPSTDVARLGRASPGDQLRIISGPHCTDSYIWWEVRYDSREAWIAEGDGSQVWLVPVSSRSSSDWPPSNRYAVPANGVLLDGGIGLSDGSVQNDGNFQVEGYCSQHDARRTNEDWFCGNQRLTISDFDRICQQTYKTPQAYAFRTGTRSVLAYNWRCYGPR